MPDTRRRTLWPALLATGVLLVAVLYLVLRELSATAPEAGATPDGHETSGGLPVAVAPDPAPAPVVVAGPPMVEPVASAEPIGE